MTIEIKKNGAVIYATIVDPDDDNPFMTALRRARREGLTWAALKGTFVCGPGWADPIWSP
jgi:hypothetical protein